MRSEIIEFRERGKEPFHQCPKCSKQSLVQRDNDRFDCLWCGFRRDLSETGNSSILGWITLPLGLLLLLLL